MCFPWRRFVALFPAPVLTALATLLWPSVAWACVCAMPAGPPCSLGDSDVVFVGRATSIAEDRAGDASAVRRFHFEVTEAFAGVSGATIEVQSSTGSCGVDFADGAAYLVAAHRTADGAVFVHACSYTRPISDAANEIDILRALRAGAAPRRLYGQVIEFRTPGPESRATDPDLYRPLSSLRVIAASGNSFHEAITDADGRFAFDDLPRGRYRVAVQVTPPRRVLEYSPGFHEVDADPSQVTVAECPVRVHVMVSEWQPLIERLPPLVEMQSCESLSQRRSAASTIAVSIRIENDRRDPIRLYWLDFSGHRVPYQTIAGGQATLQETFTSHRWIVTTEDDRCLAIFEPSGARSIAQVR